MATKTTTREVLDSARCSSEIDRFYQRHGNVAMRAVALKVLRMLEGSDPNLRGNSSGWAGGIVYFVANRDRTPCGVPGLLNSELAEFFGVAIETIRRRAADVRRRLEI